MVLMREKEQCEGQLIKTEMYFEDAVYFRKDCILHKYIQNLN